jgi:hypothetical protein
MNSEQIAHALRLVAMGRVNHPEVLEFSDKLAEVFAGPKEADVVYHLAPTSTFDKGGMLDVEGGQAAVAAASKEPRTVHEWSAAPVAEASTPKRGPGRPKKAE